MKSFLFITVVLGALLWVGDGKDIGKLKCDEKAGMIPDSKLLNMIMSKCQPKQEEGPDAADRMAAGLIKCMMRQYKALDKKTGKMKKKEAMLIINIFEEKFHANITTKFEECFTKHNDECKKEANGAASWIPFTKCFYDFSQGLCPKKE